MATIEDNLLERWRLFVPDLAYNAEFGIPAFWLQHPEIGSPVGPERDLDDGGKAQTFTNAVVQWSQDEGARVVTG
jgi:hypothetical protein